MFSYVFLEKLPRKRNFLSVQGECSKIIDVAEENCVFSGGFNSQVQLMLTDVVTNAYDREKQLGTPDGEIAPR